MVVFPACGSLNNVSDPPPSPAPAWTIYAPRIQAALVRPRSDARLMVKRVVALRANGLVKAFGTTQAIDDVNIELAPGQVQGLLGANGAGKTTLLRMLFGLVTPDAGWIELLGQRRTGFGPAAVDGVGGFVERPGFYPYLTGRANLELLAELDGAPARSRVDAVLGAGRLA